MTMIVAAMPAHITISPNKMVNANVNPFRQSASRRRLKPSHPSHIEITNSDGPNITANCCSWLPKITLGKMPPNCERKPM